MKMWSILSVTSRRASYTMAGYVLSLYIHNKILSIHIYTYKKTLIIAWLKPILYVDVTNDFQTLTKFSMHSLPPPPPHMQNVNMQKLTIHSHAMVLKHIFCCFLFFFLLLLFYFHVHNANARCIYTVYTECNSEMKQGQLHFSLDWKHMSVCGRISFWPLTYTDALLHWMWPVWPFSWLYIENNKLYIQMKENMNCRGVYLGSCNN